MEFKDLFDKDKIKKKSPEEVLDAAIQSINFLGPVILISEEKNELAYKMPTKAKFDVLEEYIKYEKNNKTDIYEIKVPSFDERKLPEFQVKLFQEKEDDCFPERGYYVTGSSKLIKRPLGLLKVEMLGIPYIRVGSDIRYTQPSNDFRNRGYQNYLYFYYDFESKEYHRVYSDKLEECKGKMELIPDAKKDYHITVQEYIKREELVDEITEKIYELTLSYLPKLKAWSVLGYGSEKGVTIGSVESYLSEYKMFLEDSMTENLKIKLFYSNSSVREYDELLKKKDSLVKLIDNSIDKIKEIKRNENLTDQNYKEYEFNSKFSLVESTAKNIEFIQNKVFPELEKFSKVRSSAFPLSISESNIMVGYIDYDLKTNEVFPNIMQLQRRTSLTPEAEDFRSENDYVARVIDELMRLEQQS